MACCTCKNGNIKINCNICNNPICDNCICEENYCFFCFNHPIKRNTIDQQIYIKQKNQKSTRCFGCFNKKIHPL